MNAPAPSLPPLPALLVGRVHHTRHRPIRHAFTHHHYQWLLDLDEPPLLPAWLRPFATVHPGDHLDGPPTLAALRTQALERLAAAGIAVPAGTRVLLQAHARQLGHVFDPMSMFWCLAPDGSVVAALVEVHNTYGDRHAYAVRPATDGRAEVDKAFFVSPFNDQRGSYELRLRLSAQHVAVAVHLDRDGERVLTATVTGRPHPATVGSVLAVLARYPLMNLRVSSLIRVHGIWLWLRRLPVHRPNRLSAKES